MTRHRLRAWSWFLGTAAVLLAGLVWLSCAIVALERDEARARQAAVAEQKLRLALWRMDSWLSPRLAREAMRPAGDYRALAPTQAAWTKGLSKIGPDEVLVPSPLLTFRSALFPVHFELAADGSLSSPQVPTGNARDVAEAEGVDGAVFEAAAARLASLSARLDPVRLGAALGESERALRDLGCNLGVMPEGPLVEQQRVDYGNRALANVQNQRESQEGLNDRLQRSESPVEPVGALVPVWLAGDTAELVFVRRIGGAAPRLQGFVVDWSNLQGELAALVRDLFAPGCAEIVRCPQADPDLQGTMLASVPARLVVRAAAADAPVPSFAGRLLGIVWAGVLLALLALGFTLRAALGFGERRARFASAVTHELRTPLTTFRMYSEMLADGVVSEPAARQEYLDTLRQESDRLARVVENVLAWSRLEQGRFASRPEPHVVGEMLERLAPQLSRRLGDAGLEFVIEVAPDAAAARLRTDEDAVGQILFNLADNAAKYARGAADPHVVLSARVASGRLLFDFADQGPGVPPSFRRRIFEAFDRGQVRTADNEQPGVGLGLALARGLANDLGGTLVLVDTARGATFRLELPLL